MKKLTLTRILALSLMILLFLVPTHAQESTQEATVEAGTVTVLGGNGEGVDITITAPAETPTEAADGSFMALIGVVVAGFVSVVVAISFGLQAIGNRARTATSNPFETVALEKLGDGVPSAVVIPLTSALERATEALANITNAWKEATDKTPAASKATPTEPTRPYAVTASGTPIPSSATPTANLPKDVTNIHELGGASTGGAEGFR